MGTEVGLCRDLVSPVGDLFVLLRVGGVVLQGLEDLLGDGRGDGQVGALGLEAVLVGHVRDGVGLAVVGHEGEGALHGQGLVLGAGVVDQAAGLGLDAVLSLVPAR